MKFGMREFLLVMLLLAVPVGSYFWVFRPSAQHLAAQQEALDSKTAKLEQLQQAATRIDDLDAEVAQLAEAVAFFEDKLPAQHEIHQVLDEIARIGQRRDLQAKLFKTRAPKTLSRYSEQPIELEIEADFNGFYQFLLDVEKMARITKIREMKIRRLPSADGQIEAKLELSIFFSDHGAAGV